MTAKIQHVTLVDDTAGMSLKAEFMRCGSTRVIISDINDIGSQVKLDFRLSDAQCALIGRLSDLLKENKDGV